MPDAPEVPNDDAFPDDAVSAHDAAAITGISSRQLLRNAKEGFFRSWVREHYKRSHPSRFYSKAELLRWVAARTRREH